MTEQKIALVTGAARGIGTEIARQLGGLGYRVHVGARDPRRGTAVVAQLAAEGVEAEVAQLEVTDPGSARAAADRILATDGRLDVLVNNAAIIADGDAAVSEVPADTLRRSFETNVIGLVTVTQAMLPLLRKAPAARIVNLSTELSSLDRVGDPSSPVSTMLMTGYNASKTAVNMVTVMLANELRDTGILVNAADPGNCATDMGGWDAPRTAAQGAAVAVRLATLPSTGPTGQLHAETGRLPW